TQDSPGDRRGQRRWRRGRGSRRGFGGRGRRRGGAVHFQEVGREQVRFGAGRWLGFGAGEYVGTEQVRFRFGLGVGVAAIEHLGGHHIAVFRFGLNLVFGGKLGFEDAGTRFDGIGFLNELGRLLHDAHVGNRGRQRRVFSGGAQELGHEDIGGGARFRGGG